MTKKIKTDFVHLHVHSEYSTLDGLPKVEDYIIKSAKLGFPALALTEHGNLRSMIQLIIKCNSNFMYGGVKYDFQPIKPIVGCEFYLTPNDYRMKGLPDDIKSKLKRKSKNDKQYKELSKQKENEIGIRKRFHVLAFAKNNIGLKNILTMNYLSWKKGFYFRPRIDARLLETYHEGIIVTTTCIGGVAPNLIINEKYDDAFEYLKYLKRIFKDDVYVEIQPHDLTGEKNSPFEGIKMQHIANKELINMADELKIKVIATNDCHYLDKNDYEAHNMLLDINSRATAKSTDRWRFGDIEFYMKSKDEMYETFRRNHKKINKDIIKQALGNTVEVAEKCNIDITVGKKQGILPKVSVPNKYHDNQNKYLVNICKKGWKWRNIKSKVKEYAEHFNISYDDAIKIYEDRLRLELKRIFKMKFTGYFLVIYDLINYARSQNIIVGAGRGSSAASLVCYLTGITSIDPVRYDLLFDRFLHTKRIDYPDIDMDFEDDRRKEVFKYLFDKYGEYYVSMIGTIGRLKGKQALQDVGRVLDIPRWETTEVTKHIITRGGGDARASQTVEDSFKEFEVSKTYNEKYPNVLPLVKKLEAKARQCLSGNVKVKINNADAINLKSVRDITINGLYHKSNYNLNRIKIKVWDGKSFVYEYIDEIIYKGIKQTYEITAISKFINKKYILNGITKDHQILQKNSKWTKLKNIKIGGIVAVNGKFVKGSIDYGKIVSIKLLGYEPVYDIIIKSTNNKKRNFIADGFVVHNCGTHAAGIIIAPFKLYKYIPIEYRKATGFTEYMPVTGIDARDCQDMGLLKIDLLGLKTLTSFRFAVEQIKKRYNVDVDLDNIPLEDKKVLDNFTAGNFSGIFQFDSIGMRKTCERLTFTSFEDVVVMNALYRPGAMRSGEAKKYIDCKSGKKKVKSVHPLYDEITKKTYGIVIYQEQLMQVFMRIAGYQPGKADIVRLKVSKSSGTETIWREREDFMAGAKKNHVKKSIAKKLFKNMSFFGSYAFNHAHAGAYSVNSYIGMWLKTYYPTEFFFGLLYNEGVDKNILEYIKEAKHIGIDIVLPDVNFSEIGFSIIDDKTINVGIAKIKNVGEIASENIVQNKPYKSLADFCNKVDRRKVNIRVIRCLINAGAFKSIYANTGALIADYDDKKVFEHMLKMNEYKGNELYKEFDIAENKLNEEDEQRLLASVSPIPSDKHEIEYFKYLKKYIAKYYHLSKISKIDYKNMKKFLLMGVIVDIKYNQVGDFFKEEPADITKKRIGWGQRYVSFNIDDGTDIKRMKLDIDAFSTFRHIIDGGVGTAVLVSVRAFANFEAIFVDIVVDLNHMRQIMDKKISITKRYKQLNKFERYFLKHPITFIKNRKNKVKTLNVGVYDVTFMIIKVKYHWTKKDDRMAFVEMEDETGTINVIFWPNILKKYNKIVNIGNIIKFKLQKTGNGNFVSDTQKVTLIKTALKYI